MKILFDHHEPFCLAHGGMEILTGETMKALQTLGVGVEHLRWWDRDQRGDVIHCFGRPNPSHIRFAHAKGIKYVFHELLTAQGSRPQWRISWQALRNGFLRWLLPAHSKLVAPWASYALADAIFASTAWEASLMRRLYGAPASRLHVIPTGVHPAFFEAGESRKPDMVSGPLLCVATVTERKGVLELIRAAIAADVPLDLIGRPYSGTDSYFLACKEEVARSGGKVRLLGAVEDPRALASVMKNARGFVLWSRMETESTAALAAAAVGLPRLLTDLPWARCVFGEDASFISLADIPRAELAGKRLGDFASQCNSSPANRARIPLWDDVARKLKLLYNDLIYRAA